MTWTNGDTITAAWLNSIDAFVAKFASDSGHANQYLKTDGAGHFSWAAVSGGGMNGINIIDYGADNTGVTDCATAVTNALAAVPSGGVLIFPAGGTFSLSTVNIDGKSFTLMAEGATINITSTSGGIIKTDKGKRVNIIGGTWTGNTGCPIIKYNGATATGNQQIELAVIRGKFTSYNAYCVELWKTRETAFIECDFTTLAASSSAACGGVYMTQANNPYFIQCQFQGQGKGNGLFMDGQGSPNSANLSIYQSEVMGWDINVRVIGADDLTINGCTIDYAITYSIYISSQDGAKITNNYIGGGGTSSNIPAIVLTSEGGLGYSPDQCRFINISNNHFTGHNTTGNLYDQIYLTAPGPSYLPTQNTIHSNIFAGYTRYAINFSTQGQLNITDNQFIPGVTNTEPTMSPVYNASGSGDSLVYITGNQFPNPTKLSGSNLSSAILFNNPGYFGNTNKAGSLITNLAGNHGIGWFPSYYWHWVDSTGPVVLDRYGNTSTIRTRSAQGTYSSPTVSGTSDIVSNLLSEAYNGTSFSGIGSWQLRTDGTQTGTSSPGRAAVLTTPSGSTTYVSRLEIDNAGNLFVNPTGASSSGKIYFNASTSGSASSAIIYGSGSPEASVTAPVSSIYFRTNGGAGTCLYVKESGTGNTGWAAVQTSASTKPYVYATSATTTCTNSGTYPGTKITFPTVVSNGGGSWASNTFTAPYTGVYDVYCLLSLTGSGTSAVNEQFRVDLYKNGTRLMNGNAMVVQNTGSAINGSTTISTSVSLSATDTLEVYVFCNTSGGSPSCNGVSQANYIVIKGA